MARAMWNGVISFGLVTIPVQLYTATESHNIAFHLLHEKCDTRIKEQRYCPHCDEQVEWGDIVKGYEYAKGSYVEITPEDLDNLPLPSKHTIDVSSFVDQDSIAPVYFDSSYYISVDEGAQKPYKLLLQVMESHRVAGLGTITFRTKERICALRATDGKLSLQTLLYEDEIKENTNEKPSSVKITPQEKEMAEHLVNALKDEFDPSKFKDKYQSALKKLIQSKLKGKNVKPVEVSEATSADDLMEALRNSVENAKHGGAKRASANGEQSEKRNAKPAKKSRAATESKTAAKPRAAKRTRRPGKKRKAA